MPIAISPKTEVFLGLNNALDPCSHKYEVGMAYVCDNSRIDESGRWNEQAALTACTSPPDNLTSPISGGNHVKNLAIDGVDKIITAIPTAASVDVGPNRKLYACNGSGYVKNAAGNITQLAPPVIATAPAETANGISTRQLAGVYHYMFTTYDTVYEKESLPSIVYSVEQTDPDNYHILLTFPAPSANTRTRIYRTRRTLAANGIWNPTNIFFYIGEAIPGQTTFIDTLRDEDIVTAQYEGKGSPPPQNVDYLAAYNDRMLYFVGNKVYWSSPGRPEEVAQPYVLSYLISGVASAGNITALANVGGGEVQVTSTGHGLVTNDVVVISRTVSYNGTYVITKVDDDKFKFTATWVADDAQGIWAKQQYTVTNNPMLSFGLYAQARYEISELAGQKVTAAFLKDGRLWLATLGMIGYLEADRRLEGYRYRVIRRGIGLINDKVIAHTPYGVFGADRRGIWLLLNDGRVQRLSDGVVDISAGSGKSTALTQAYIADSFGVWLPQLEEYWWSCQTGSVNLTKITGNGTTVGVNATAHGFSVGDLVTISGTENFDSADNVILTVADADSFTYADTPVATELLTGTAGSYIQIVYQANRGLFVGPYSHGLVGGTNFVSAGGAQAFLNDGVSSFAGKDGIPASSPVVPQRFNFWLGQEDLSTVKKNTKLEVIYASITSGKSVTATTYHNKIASTTGITSSGNYTHSSDDLVGRLTPSDSGRMFMVELALPADCLAPILSIDYRTEYVPWLEKNLR